MSQSTKVKKEQVRKGGDEGKEKLNFSKFLRMPSRFSAVNKLIMRDSNGRNSSPTFSRYSKDDINTYLQNPYTYEKQLRAAAIYIYGASSHFRRLIQYFTSLTDFSYVVSPHGIDPSTVQAESMRANYYKVLNAMTAFSVKSQLPNVLTVCLREDVYYGTMWVTDSSVILQQLTSDYCRIDTIEDGVPNVTFDFSYFDSRGEQLEFYPPEFGTKYNIYQSDRQGAKWQELDSPTSFAVKCNKDVLNYAVPPFVGVLREVYDIEDYKQLKLTKTELENYAMLVMTLGVDKEGDWVMDLDRAKEFWRNLDGILPEEVGSILSPMPIEKISFEKSNTGHTDTIVDAEQHMFTSAGVSSLLFNNESASSGALSLSIKADQALTFGIVKSLEDVVNRYLRSESFGKDFKVTFLDCSSFNRAELGDMYLKACQYGVPMVSYYCASQGLPQAEMECMNFLERDMLGLTDKFIPLQSSSTQSSDSGSGLESDDEGGAPEKSLEDLSDSGEQSREDGDDW